MKKILFGITGLTLGGAERVLVDIVNELKGKYEIEIFTIYAGGELEKQLHKDIKIKSMYNFSYNSMTKLQKILVPLKILLFKKSIYKKQIAGDYDVEVAFLEGAITRLFTVKNKKANIKAKKIVWVHNDISKVFGTGFKSRIKKIVDKKIYGKYDKIVFVSNDNLNKFNQVYKEIRNKDLELVKKDVAYNYVNSNEIIEKSKEKVEIEFDKEYINFITVARLVNQKGYDRLIKAVKEVKNSNIDTKFRFYAIGEGPERINIEKLIKETNLEDTFILLGGKTNPYPYVKNADYFCLLSHFEGFPLVLEEAKILNMNILITNTAAREVIGKYANGTIVENSSEGIVKGLDDILKNSKEKKKEREKQEDNNNQKQQEKATKYENTYMIKKIEEILEG